MTIKEMIERKKELGYSYERLSELSGVPVGTIQKVLGGITKSPRYETLLALERALEKKDDWIVRENLAAYGTKRQGEYTVEDYLALPDGERMELIEGVLYNMSAPTSVHQAIAGCIHTKLNNYVMSKKGTCIPLISPVDVQLDCDNRTMLQPDVLVVCDRDKFQRGIIYGAPDFVVEVISPSTGKKDIGLKCQKYADAGVREYWVVDPYKQSVVVYIMNEDDYYSISFYTFQDEVPVHIFHNDCKVNFREIYDYVEFMYEK